MDLHPKQFARLCVQHIKDEKGVERVVDRNFSVDPRTITHDRLRYLLARALDIRQDFDLLFYRREGGAVPLMCDWDLEGALSEEPRIDLALQLKPKEPGFEEWDIICAADVPVTGHEPTTPTVHCRKRGGTLLEQIFWPRASSSLSESEFVLLADWPCPLRYAVYRAEGAEPSIRPSLWMLLLDVFPAGASHRERAEFLNQKAEEYYGLRHSWQKLVQAGTIPSILHDITCLVRKDVRRTDCLQDLDEHALYNILTTYAVHHPSVSYCQGMSDLLSPLLHVMNTEALAYVAFCGLMLRMRDNFRRDGRSVCTKFRHLRRALRTHDRQLYDYLSSVGALDLLFCYRWLLLDLKREFQYDEMLRLMEVQWSTLRPLNCEKGVELYEVRFPTASIKKKIDPKDLLVFTENYFGSPKGLRKVPERTKAVSLKRWALLSRRRSIFNAESDFGSSTEDEEGGIVHYNKRRRRRSRNVCRSWSGRDSTGKGQKLCYSNTLPDVRFDDWLDDPNDSVGRRRHGSTDSNYESNFSEDDLLSEEDEALSRDKSEGYMSDQHTLTTESEVENPLDDSSLNLFDSADTYFNSHPSAALLLPPPTRFGDGKPFLMFVCLAMLLNHRDVILTQKMDANEIGIYFDRLVRQHKLDEVLPKAKQMFFEYLNSGWTDDD